MPNEFNGCMINKNIFLPYSIDEEDLTKKNENKHGDEIIHEQVQIKSIEDVSNQIKFVEIDNKAITINENDCKLKKNQIIIKKEKNNSSFSSDGAFDKMNKKCEFIQKKVNKSKFHSLN